MSLMTLLITAIFLQHIREASARHYVLQSENAALRRNILALEKEIRVLSVISFLHGDNSCFIHFHCLLLLAEAIEVIYLETQVAL